MKKNNLSVLLTDTVCSVVSSTGMGEIVMFDVTSELVKKIEESIRLFNDSSFSKVVFSLKKDINIRFIRDNKKDVIEEEISQCHNLNPLLDGDFSSYIFFKPVDKIKNIELTVSFHEDENLGVIVLAKISGDEFSDWSPDYIYFAIYRSDYEKTFSDLMENHGYSLAKVSRHE